VETHRVETLRMPHFLDNWLSDGGEVVSLTSRPPFTPPGRFLILISVRGLVDPRATVQLEGFRPIEKSKTLSGIEPATFHLVA
jgi:hypothetical protein